MRVWQGSSLPHLPEGPFRTHHPLHEAQQWVPGGSLLKFLRRLSQFQLSFPAESRRVPAPPAKCALGPTAPRSLSSLCSRHGGRPLRKSFFAGGADLGPGRPQRGPYTGRGARTAGLVGDRTRQEFTILHVMRPQTLPLLPSRSGRPSRCTGARSGTPPGCGHRPFWPSARPGAR